ARIREETGESQWLRLPTVFWLGCTDRHMKFAAIAGIVLSLMVTFDVASGPALLGLWLLYLSFVNTCGPFMSFQWDVLIIETGFLAIFLDQWKLLPGLPTAAPAASILLLARLLLFRLMFMSGAVKWLSGDRAWRDGSAMSYHYETQPLPTPVSFY